MVAVVTATGGRTYFGRTTSLVSEAKPVSHFQKAVLHIGDYLIYLSLALVAVLVLVELFRGEPFLQLVQFALILTVAAIPVAMPAVLSVTMAVGPMHLSKLKAIVSRLEVIEEMAGMDVLCSDKTGTLTQNRLSLGKPVVQGGIASSEVVLAGALASKEEDRDPIDLAILAGLGLSELDRYRQEAFTPFDPVSKRATARVVGPGGARFSVTKGAPQVILSLCELGPADRSRLDAEVTELAGKGYRTLGVARSDDDRSWRFLGLVPLFDPHFS